jgi:hypothetical protein
MFTGIDPPAGLSYLLLEQAGSPEIASIRLPVYGTIGGWKLRYLGDSGWADYAIAEDGLFHFDDGAAGLEFLPVDFLGNEIAQADPFIFDLRFASTGDFGATLDVRVPSNSVPEPGAFALILLGLVAMGIARRLTFPRFFVFQQAGFMLPVFPSVEPSASHA